MYPELYEERIEAEPICLNGKSNVTLAPCCPFASSPQHFSDFGAYLQELPPADVLYDEDDDMEDDQSLGWSWGALESSEIKQETVMIQEHDGQADWREQGKITLVASPTEDSMTADDDIAQRTPPHSSAAADDLPTTAISPASKLIQLRDQLREAMKASAPMQLMSGRRGYSDCYRREAMLFSNVHILLQSVEEAHDYEPALQLALDIEYMLKRKNVGLVELAAVVDGRLSHRVDVSSFAVPRGSYELPWSLDG